MPSASVGTGHENDILCLSFFRTHDIGTAEGNTELTQRIILSDDFLIHLNKNLIEYLLGIKHGEHAGILRLLRRQIVVLFDFPLNAFHIRLIEAVVL